MNSLNKVFEYKGYKFNICVELNFLIERSINGKRLHQITINCTGQDSYYDKFLTDGNDLKKSVELAEQKAKEYVDAKYGNDRLTEIEKELIEMGFTQQKTTPQFKY